MRNASSLWAAVSLDSCKLQVSAPTQVGATTRHVLSRERESCQWSVENTLWSEACILCMVGFMVLCITCMRHERWDLVLRILQILLDKYIRGLEGVHAVSISLSLSLRFHSPFRRLHLQKIRELHPSWIPANERPNPGKYYIETLLDKVCIQCILSVVLCWLSIVGSILNGILRVLRIGRLSPTPNRLNTRKEQVNIFQERSVFNNKHICESC